jgi:Mg-chelatase subunit ChlD
MDITASNIPTLGSKIWVIMDTSGSMKWTNANKTASFLAAAVLKAHGNAKYLAFTKFATNAHNMSGLNPADSVWTLYSQIVADTFQGGSTNFEAALEMEKTLGFTPDVVFLLTDGEVNTFGDRRYGVYTNNVTTCAPGALKFVINTASAETTPVPPRFGWTVMAGFSTKMFDLIDLGKKTASIIAKLDVPYPYVGKI